MMQILADVFDLQCVRVAGPSSAGRGAAICAAVATGTVCSFAEGVERFASRPERTVPCPDQTNVYRRLGEVYRDVRDATDPIYRRTWDIVG
jgi:sugar (pentulose or hexulose) kinase